jgi:hypothetical protein
MKMAGELVSEGVRCFEATEQRKILSDPRKFATRGDFGKKPLEDFRLGPETS